MLSYMICDKVVRHDSMALFAMFVLHILDTNVCQSFMLLNNCKILKVTGQTDSSWVK